MHGDVFGQERASVEVTAARSYECVQIFPRHRIGLRVPFIELSSLPLCPMTAAAVPNNRYLMTAQFAKEVGLLRTLAPNLISKPSPFGPITGCVGNMGIEQSPVIGQRKSRRRLAEQLIQAANRTYHSPLVILIEHGPLTSDAAWTASSSLGFYGQKTSPQWPRLARSRPVGLQCPHWRWHTSRCKKSRPRGLMMPTDRTVCSGGCSANVPNRLTLSDKARA
jgi:hypothetical protein